MKLFYDMFTITVHFVDAEGITQLVIPAADFAATYGWEATFRLERL